MAHLTKKVLILVSIFHISSTSFAEEAKEEALDAMTYLPYRTSDQTKNIKSNALEEPAVDNIVYFPSKNTQKTPEWNLSFVRLGSALQSNSDNTNSGNMVGGIGHRKIADSFVYGFEYSYHYNDTEKSRYSDIDLSLGYRPTTSHRVSPVIMGGFGYSFLSGDKHAQGLNYFIDFGLELIKVDVAEYKFVTLAGIRNTNQKFSGGLISDKNYTDLYLGLGFSW